MPLVSACVEVDTDGVCEGSDTQRQRQPHHHIVVHVPVAYIVIHSTFCYDLVIPKRKRGINHVVEQYACCLLVCD